MAADDWVHVDADEICNADQFCSADEWILLASDEGSIAAIFFGRAAASIGGAEVPPLSAAAPAVAAASSCGRVLLRGAWSQYFVLDPLAGECHVVPRSLRPRSHAAALFDAAIASSDSKNYSVVCAFDDRFEIYKTEVGAWREVADPAAAGVVAGSAVASANCVYWKVSSSTGVLVLDVVSGASRQIAPPPAAAYPAAHWQLGVAAGQLSAAVTTEDTLELYALSSGDDWKLLHNVPIAMVAGGCWGAWPRPLRFESDGLEVLLRMGGRVVAVDLPSGTAREARLEGSVLPKSDEDLVPWCRAVSTILL